MNRPSQNQYAMRPLEYGRDGRGDQDEHDDPNSSRGRRPQHVSPSSRRQLSHSVSPVKSRRLYNPQDNSYESRASSHRRLNSAPLSPAPPRPSLLTRSPVRSRNSYATEVGSSSPRRSDDRQSLPRPPLTRSLSSDSSSHDRRGYLAPSMMSKSLRHVDDNARSNNLQSSRNLMAGSSRNLQSSRDLMAGSSRNLVEGSSRNLQSSRNLMAGSSRNVMGASRSERFILDKNDASQRSFRPGLISSPSFTPQKEKNSPEFDDGDGEDDEEHVKTEHERLVEALGRGDFHLPGNTYKEDWLQYFANNHPLLAPFCQNPAHPISKCMRFVGLVGSVLIGLAITNVVWLFFEYNKEEEVFASVSAGGVQVDNETKVNIIGDEDSVAAKIADETTGQEVTTALIVLMTAGGAVHAIYDNLIWYATSCACSRRWEWMKEYKNAGTVTAILSVVLVTIGSGIMVFLRVGLENDAEKGNSTDVNGINQNTVETDVNELTDSSNYLFLMGYGIEMAVAWFVYFPIIESIMFSGVLGCFGVIPCLSGRPYEVKQEEIDRAKERGEYDEETGTIIKPDSEKNMGKSTRSMSRRSGSSQNGSVVGGSSRSLWSRASSRNVLQQDSSNRSLSVSPKKACSGDMDDLERGQSRRSLFGVRGKMAQSMPAMLYTDTPSDSDSDEEFSVQSSQRDLEQAPTSPSKSGGRAFRNWLKNELQDEELPTKDEQLDSCQQEGTQRADLLRRQSSVPATSGTLQASPMKPKRIFSKQSSMPQLNHVQLLDSPIKAQDQELLPVEETTTEEINCISGSPEMSSEAPTRHFPNHTSIETLSGSPNNILRRPPPRTLPVSSQGSNDGVRRVSPTRTSSEDSQRFGSPGNVLRRAPPRTPSEGSQMSIDGPRRIPPARTFSEGSQRYPGPLDRRPPSRTLSDSSHKPISMFGPVPTNTQQRLVQPLNAQTTPPTTPGQQRSFVTPVTTPGQQRSFVTPTAGRGSLRIPTDGFTQSAIESASSPRQRPMMGRGSIPTQASGRGWAVSPGRGRGRGRGRGPGPGRSIPRNQMGPPGRGAPPTSSSGSTPQDSGTSLLPGASSAVTPGRGPPHAPFSSGADDFAAVPPSPRHQSLGSASGRGPFNAPLPSPVKTPVGGRGSTSPPKNRSPSGRGPPPPRMSPEGRSRLNGQQFGASGRQNQLSMTRGPLPGRCRSGQGGRGRRPVSPNARGHGRGPLAPIQADQQQSSNQQVDDQCIIENSTPLPSPVKTPGRGPTSPPKNRSPSGRGQPPPRMNGRGSPYSGRGRSRGAPPGRGRNGQGGRGRGLVPPNVNNRARGPIPPATKNSNIRNDASDSSKLSC